MKSKSKNSVFIVRGDFNLPDIDWKNLNISGSQYPQSTSKHFLDMIADSNLEQLVDFPTSKDKILDLILTTHPSFKMRCRPMPSIGNRDHEIVLLDTSIRTDRPRPARWKILLWKKADRNAIKKDTRNLATEFLNTAYTDIELMWHDFKTKITEIITKRVPSQLTCSKYTNLWMNSTIKRTIRRKQKAFKKARKTEIVTRDCKKKSSGTQDEQAASICKTSSVTAVQTTRRSSTATSRARVRKCLA